jgi:hypothetical protein
MAREHDSVTVEEDGPLLLIGVNRPDAHNLWNVRDFGPYFQGARGDPIQSLTRSTGEFDTVVAVRSDRRGPVRLSPAAGCGGLGGQRKPT